MFIASEIVRAENKYELYHTFVSLEARLGNEAVVLEYSAGEDSEIHAFYLDNQPWREQWDEPDLDADPSEEQLRKALDLLVAVAHSNEKLDWIGIGKSGMQASVIE